MGNSRTQRVVYWVNVSESSGAGSPGLCPDLVLLLICVS